MQPLYGRLSDIFGRKVCLIASLVIFFLGSLGCSVSASMIQLIVFRAIQGIGGGGILTLSMIIGKYIILCTDRGLPPSSVRYRHVEGPREIPGHYRDGHCP